MTKALVLNADYQPISCVNWKRALTLTFINEECPGEGAELVEYYRDKFVRSAGGRQFKLPAVIRKAQYVKFGKEVKFSKKNLIIRDNCRCQYCWQRFPPNQLTIDHIIPRAEWRRRKIPGSPTIWENVVCACRKCNFRKGEKPLDKCGMTLLEKPIEPPKGSIIGNFAPWNGIPDEWKPYVEYMKYYRDFIT